MVVLDTHVLLWWTLDPDRLSPEAVRLSSAFPETGVCVSSISLWEIGVNMKRGQLEIGTKLTDYWNRLRQIDWLEVTPVTAEIWLENVELDWDHRDPADRTIVATAKLPGLPILSKDTAVAAFYPQTIW